MPSYTNALANWVPEIWSQLLQRNWDEKFQMKNVVNRDYEGEIKKAGNTVHIPTIGEVTISDYNSAGTLTYETIDAGDDTLPITEEKAYSFKIGDIDQAQARVKDGKSKNITRAAINMDRTVDNWLLSDEVIGDGIDEGIQQVLHAGTALGVWVTATAYAVGIRKTPTTLNGLFYEVISVAGTGTTGGVEPVWPTTVGATIIDNAGANQITWQCAGYVGYAAGSGDVSASNVYKYLVAAKRIMVRANTWVKGEMCAVIAPEIMELIETTDELIHATEKGDEVLRMGFMGELAGWKLLESVNVRGAGTAASPYINVLCNMDCINFADQFTEGPEAIRLEGTFDTGCRGLMVYGATVTERMAQAGIRWETELA